MSKAASITLLEKHADQVSRTLAEQIESVVSDCAARGFSEIQGSAAAQMCELGSNAMQSLYSAALSIRPSVAQADSTPFVAAFDSALNSLALSAVSRARGFMPAASHQARASRSPVAAKVWVVACGG